MAYCVRLAERIREQFSRLRGIAEKKMFGGVAFLLNGNVCVGVWKDSLVARLGPDQAVDALREPCVREFDITGRPMTGWVLVSGDGIDDDDSLREWIEHAVTFVRRLPAKPATPRAPRKVRAKHPARGQT